MDPKVHRSGQGNTGPDHNVTRSRSWCFTSYAKAKPIMSDKMKYLCYSPEVCPTSQRNHWQGYVYLTNPTGLKGAQKLIGPGTHMDAARGTPQENRIYCGGERYEKDGKIKDANPEFAEFGRLPAQGQRTDLADTAAAILDGSKTVEDILISDPMQYHQYGRTLQALEEVRMRKLWRTEMTQGVWRYGPTGVGKSHFAFEGYDPETHYVHPIEDKGWWDGYRQQETVIINDFRGQIAYDVLLQMVDKWPFHVPRRHKGPIPFTSKTVIITSSMHPADVYHNRDSRDSIEQLLRRFEIVKITENNLKESL